jgi:ribosomal protein S18 acetylase RimI-like enzyme
MKPDWREGYREQLSTLVEGEKRQRFWVAKLGGQIAGYAVWDFMEKPQEAELLLLCVDPAFRRRGVASALNQQVLTDMRHNGVRFAMVETGGDAAHAGARAAYEKVGFVPLACVRYFQLLDEDMKENDNEPSTQG